MALKINLLTVLNSSQILQIGLFFPFGFLLGFEAAAQAAAAADVTHSDSK